MFKKSEKGYYFWDEFSKFKGLVHGVSTKFFGSIKNNGNINERNLKGFLDILRIDRENTVFPEQVHGSSVVTIDDSKKQFILNADGLITNKKNVFLGVVTADCLPVIFYDKKSEMVGIAHAGYKGILKAIVKNMVLSFEKLGSNTKDIKVAIGPSIGVCCYDVSIERIKMFDKLLNSDGDSGQDGYQTVTRQARMTTLELLDQVLKATDYLSLYDQKDEEDRGRLENIKELRSVAINFPNLSNFLENVSLVEQEYLPDRPNGEKKDAVTLMTLHAAKGLEFPIVFMIGMEEGLFPHSRSIMDKNQLEEERRLCYVGMTRAKQKLYLTYARRRLFFGQRTSNMISRFILELPENVISQNLNPSNFL